MPTSLWSQFWESSEAGGFGLLPDTQTVLTHLLHDRDREKQSVSPCYIFLSSCMSRGGTNERMTPAGGSTLSVPVRGLQLLCGIHLFVITETGFYCWKYKKESVSFSITVLHFISANGEFPPVATSTTRLPLTPNLKTPPPSIQTPPVLFPTTDYCKSDLDFLRNMNVCKLWFHICRGGYSGIFCVSTSFCFLTCIAYPLAITSNSHTLNVCMH